MEKLKKIPTNHIKNIKHEAYIDHAINGYGPGSRWDTREPRLKVSAEIVFEVNDNEDCLFIERLTKEKSINFVSKMDFDTEKFRYVMNNGYKYLPILLKHDDPEIAKLAWILSEYFSMRNEIMPTKQVIE